MMAADVRLYSVNEIHTDKMNAKHNNVLEKSQRKMFQSKEGQYCKIVSSSSLTLITRTAYDVPQETPAGDDTLHA